MHKSTDDRTPAERRARPEKPQPESREKLLGAALELMSQQPARRVSARAIAGHAGIDPALVTYHFGSRAGLVKAAAELATGTLRYRMALGYGSVPDIRQAVARAVEDPVAAMAGEPLLTQVYVSELLLDGASSADGLLKELAAPYYEELDAALGAAIRRGELRQIDRPPVMHALAAVSLLPFILGPFHRRRRKTPGGEIEELAAAMVDLLLFGVSSEARGVPPARGGRAGGGDGPSRHELIDVALGLLRSDIDADITTERVAAAADVPDEVLKRHFIDSSGLALAVARAAVTQLPAPGRDARSSGRRSAGNPALERDLIVAATGLIGAGARPVTASAVASRAGCDPALVTYYFGNRSGLMRAVAAEVLRDLVAQFEAAYDPVVPVVPRLMQALRPPMRTVASKPEMSRFLLDEFLVHGAKADDDALLAATAPMRRSLVSSVREGRAAGELMDAGLPTLLYGVGVLPIYLVAAVPVFRQAHSGLRVSLEPDVVTELVIELVFDGLLTAKGRALG